MSPFNRMPPQIRNRIPPQVFSKVRPQSPAKVQPENGPAGVGTPSKSANSLPTQSDVTASKLGGDEGRSLPDEPQDNYEAQSSDPRGRGWQPAFGGVPEQAPSSARSTAAAPANATAPSLEQPKHLKGKSAFVDGVRDFHVRVQDNLRWPWKIKGIHQRTSASDSEPEKLVESVPRDHPGSNSLAEVAALDPRGQGWQPAFKVEPSELDRDTQNPSPSAQAVSRDSLPASVDEPKSLKRKFIGEVRGFRADDEAGWTFRLHQYDVTGNHLPALQVERWNVQQGAIIDGDRVEVEGTWCPGRIVHVRRIYNCTTGMVVKKQHKLRFGKDAAFKGEVRGLNEVRSGPGQKQNLASIARTFRLQRYDEKGNVLAPLLVEMRAPRFVGSISEGDRVEVFGKWREGEFFDARKILNRTTNSVVKRGFSFLRFWLGLPKYFVPIGLALGAVLFLIVPPVGGIILIATLVALFLYVPIAILIINVTRASKR